jgi:putative DNA primase/helicase
LPVRRCGKTTLLGLLIRLVRRPLPASNVTPAVVFRVIDKYQPTLLIDYQPTLLIDEADTFLGDKRELIGIFNSGHTKDTAFILRSDGEKFEPRHFPTFAAIAIAQIGKLPPNLEDRSIVIWMRRRRHDETVEKFREDHTSDLVELKRKVIRWVIDNRAVLVAADPEMPNNLNDRAADNCRILLAVADVAGSHWPETARQVVATIAGDKEDDSLPVMLLNDIEEIFERTSGRSNFVRGLVPRAYRPGASPLGRVRRIPDHPESARRHARSVRNSAQDPTDRRLHAPRLHARGIRGRVFLLATPASKAQHRNKNMISMS